MLETLNSELGDWLAAVSRSRCMAQMRLLLSAFGFTMALLYLGAEFAGKILARARSSDRR